jgi:hypothetical protein
MEAYTGLNAITAGYGATAAAMAKQAASIGGAMSLGLVGGGVRSRLTKRLTKRLKKGQKRAKSVKKLYKKHKKKRRVKRKTQAKEAKQNIIKSIEHGKPIAKKTLNKLSPSMKRFLAGIETDSRSRSIIRFSDFKKDKKGKKGKKGKGSTKRKKKSRTR